MIQSQIKQEIRNMLISVGAERVGFATAEPIDDSCKQRYFNWIEKGCNADMKYLENYPDIRQDPRLLLEGAKTIISLAFNYYPPTQRDSSLPYISLYAYGQDYHDVLRKRLLPICQHIEQQWNAKTRICIDSAPIIERYWAWRAGLGYQGINGTFIIPGHGSYFFLAEIITTLEIEPDQPIDSDCGKCGRCIRECPTKAISGNGTIDASKCLSYLTIECRNEWDIPQNVNSTLFGCDKCQQICHHNRRATPTTIEEFYPSEKLLSLNYNDVKQMADDDFRITFRHSPIKRTKLSGLLRNLAKLKLENYNEPTTEIQKKK